MMVTPVESPASPVPRISLPPTKWEVFTAIRRTQLQARLAWTSSKVEHGPCLGVAHASYTDIIDDEVVEYLVFSDFIRDDKLGLTIIPSFEKYARLWRDAGMVNPFSFTFWHNSVTMQRSDWFRNYYNVVMATLDEQVVIWGADENTEDSKVFKAVVAYVEALRLLMHHIN